MKQEIDRFRVKYPQDNYNMFDSLYSNMLGFDPDFEHRFTRSAANSTTTYPPYDTIQDSENSYRVVVATAGFSEKEISITVEKNQLTISGEKEKQKEEMDVDKESDKVPLSLYPKHLHRGIAMRKFVRSFMLGEYVVVTNAVYENGLLTVYLERQIPEEQKPRKIEIQSNFPRLN